MEYLVFVVLILCFITSAAVLDPCIFTSKIYSPKPDNATETIVPTPSCNKGKVNWAYPKGWLVIEFVQKAPFTLCLTDWIEGGVLTFFDNSSLRHRPLKIVSTEPQCFRSHGSKAVLEVKAPTILMYLAGFAFEIKN